MAQNVGLFLFGLLAVLGELTCLTTTVVVLPAVLSLVQPRSRAGTPPFEGDAASTAAGSNTPPPERLAPLPGQGVVP